MINKIADSVAQALAGVRDGATVLIGGFGTAGHSRRADRRR
jgi:3-oxoadipate CoA-transferase alpha subunit